MWLRHKITALRPRRPYGVPTKGDSESGLRLSILDSLIDSRDVYRASRAELVEDSVRRIRPLVGPTNNPDQFDQFLAGSESPEALAMFRHYGLVAGLDDGVEDWTISCLPFYSGAGGERRAGTVSVSRNEAFYIWMDLASGRVTSWGFEVDDPIATDATFWPGGTADLSLTRHGWFLTGTSFEDFGAAISDAAIAASAKNAIRVRRSKNSVRQHQWHNPRLSDWLSLGSRAEGDGIASATAWSVPIRYASATVAVRLHQASFRRNLLSNTNPVECALCGLKTVAILDAAHVVADSKGGAADSDNGILLCANHHRAMDAGLWEMESGGPRWREDVKPF